MAEKRVGYEGNWRSALFTRMQKIWFVIVSLDRVLSANVLSVRLDPANTEQKASPWLPFIRLKDALFSASVHLERFIATGVSSPNPWLNKLLKKSNFKDLYTLERIIDCYLINFERLNIRDPNTKQMKPTLKYTSLEHSMLHKIKRAVPITYQFNEVLS